MENTTIAGAAARYGISTCDATHAAELVAGGQVDALAMSGKQGSGKDSHGLALLEARGRTGPLHGSFAAALKEEVNDLQPVDRCRWACRAVRQRGRRPVRYPQ